MTGKLESFSIVRIYSDINGESHFEDVDIPLNDSGKIGFLSELYPAKGLIFRNFVPSYDYELHNAPARQFLMVLDGEIEIETSLGVKRRFIAGDVLLLEDTTGKGHKTKNLKQEIRKSVFVVLE